MVPQTLFTAPLLTLLNLFALLSVFGLAAAEPPQCTQQYGSVSSTLQTATLNAIGLTSTSSQMVGMYSTHVGTYAGFGRLIPSALKPVTNFLTTTYIPLLQAAEVKCNVCTDDNGDVKYAHPGKTPVINYADLAFLMQLTKNMVDDIDTKYCNADADEAYEGSGGKPSHAVAKPIKNFLDAAFATFRTGEDGALYEFVQCFEQYGQAQYTGPLVKGWKAVNAKLEELQGSGCV